MSISQSGALPYEPYAYSDAPLKDAFWRSTVPDLPELPFLNADIRAEFAIVGGGFTGLAAALRLAESGADVVLLDANAPGWGASGRNGGLVSIGSAKLGDKALETRFGRDDANTFYQAERAAVEAVVERQRRFNIDADQHGTGYTLVAHHARAIAGIESYGEIYRRRYGLNARLLDASEMREEGLSSPDFCAAVNVPLGCAINPMKMHRGLLLAVQQAGVRVFANSAVQSVTGQFSLHTEHGSVRAKKLLIATNGYGSDDLPGYRHRVLPVQSNILVSRPLTETEIESQGWSSDQMVVDSRRLLHYFRLMPDRRMLLGLRGTVRASADSLARTRARARADFDRMFPAWRHVETPFFWSGLIAMSRELVPIAGPVPGVAGAWMAGAYHGSGVAMAPYCGELIADMALGQETQPHPMLMRRVPRRFELGQFRRAVLPAVFGGYAVLDRFGV